MKLCVDCKHYKKVWFIFRVCDHSNNRETDPVTGSWHYRFSPKETRASIWEAKGCGHNGKWWEKRE